MASRRASPTTPPISARWTSRSTTGRPPFARRSLCYLPGQRLHVEGTSLPKQRYPRELAFPAAYEAVILAQRVREVHQKARAKAAPNPALTAAATREAPQPAAPVAAMSPVPVPLALTA